jgi:hypothetical protein
MASRGRVRTCIDTGRGRARTDACTAEAWVGMRRRWRCRRRGRLLCWHLTRHAAVFLRGAPLSSRTLHRPRRWPLWPMLARPCITPPSRPRSSLTPMRPWRRDVGPSTLCDLSLSQALPRTVPALRHMHRVMTHHGDDAHRAHLQGPEGAAQRGQPAGTCGVAGDPRQLDRMGRRGSACSIWATARPGRG